MAKITLGHRQPYTPPADAPSGGESTPPAKAPAKKAKTVVKKRTTKKG